MSKGLEIHTPTFCRNCGERAHPGDCHPSLGLGQATTSVPALPRPPAGPNTREVFTGEYDPDTHTLRIGMDGDVEFFVEFDKLPGCGNTDLRLQLGESKLSPTVTLSFENPGTPPKFNSVEEAEAWLEAHS